MTKTSGQTIGHNHRIDKTIGEEVIDAKNVEPEMKIEIGVEIEYIIDGTLVMTEIEVEIEIGVEQERMTKDIKAQNSNSQTRNRSTSRVTMNRDRVRCYNCRENDHFANECPN